MVLETKRLLLREMKPDDFQALFLVFGDPETMWHYPYTFNGQHVKDWIERNMNRYRKDGFGLWAVCLKETGELIGRAGVESKEEWPEDTVEMGYVIGRNHQRMGYATELCEAILQYAFENLEKTRVICRVHPDNIASVRLMERLGFTKIDIGGENDEDVWAKGY